MLLNWRKAAMRAFFPLTGMPVFRHLRFVDAMATADSAVRVRAADEMLAALLVHAAARVPYYREVLGDVGAVRDGLAVLDRFGRIPVLTKDIIRAEGERLYAEDRFDRGCYANTSGGSTGEPVRLIQDRSYRAWGLACRIYYNRMGGKDVGQRELKLWGSEREILAGREPAKTLLRRWAFNVVILNSFRMSPEIMAGYVHRWNRFRPRMVWAYTSSIHAFARHLAETGSTVRPPQAIVVTAETLTEQVRRLVEETIGCPVLNQYGSREVGVVACECPHQTGLHMFSLNNHVEILDDTLRPCRPGQMGTVYVTNLHNYAMPLIRYRVGDTAVPAEPGDCPCGRTMPRLAKLTGRTSDHFRTRAGAIVHGEYFTHLFYGLDAVRSFRVTQLDYEEVEILLVLDGAFDDGSRAKVVEGVRHVLGPDCEVTFREVDEIPRAASGKYRYTISKVGGD